MGNADVERVYPMHRNIKARGSAGHVLAGGPGIHPIDLLGYEHFVHLTGQAHLVLSDSEGIEEESHVFGKPTLIM